MGSDYGDEDSISWACKADVPKYFKLGSTDVICEGYANPDDPYVLKGSCGVEYRLMLTDAGYEKYGGSSFKVSKFARSSNDLWPTMFGFIFFAVLAYIVYSAITQARTGGPPRAPRIPNPRPWFGGGGDDDPPPPYDPFFKPSIPGPAQPGGWRPGFWSGLGTGMAGSYLMNRGRNEPRAYSPPRRRPFESYGSPGGSSFAESSSAGAARHETTGYGQTRRR